MSWRLLLAFAAGVIAATLTPLLPPTWLLLTLMLPSLAFLAWLRAPVMAAGIIGVVWFLLHAGWHSGQQWPPELAGEQLTLTATVVGLPELRGQSTRFVLRPDGRAGIDGESDAGLKLPRRIQVSWYRPGEHLMPGQRWEMTLRLLPPHGRLNEGGFDLHRHLLANRIGAIATVVDQPRLLDGPTWRAAADGQRQFVAEVLQAETVDGRAAALTRALAIADRSAMSPELSEMLRQTGTAHLLAISGLHIGMIAGVAGLLGGWLLAPLVLVHAALDRRRLALFAALAAATAYALMAGFTLPTQRALIMLTVAAGAFVLRRGIQPGHALILALVAVLLIDPLAPLATGFWLSFMAVTVLIWAFAWRPGSMSGARAWLVGLVRAQLIIAVGMLPLNVGVFQQLIPVALAANLVAIPMVGFWILPGLLLSVALILMRLPADWPLWLTESGLVILLRTLEFLQQLEFGHHAVSSGGLVALVLALVGALWLLGPTGWPARWLGAMLMVPLLWPPVDTPGAGELEMRLLDVGNGLAVAIRTTEELILYDTGPGDGEGADALHRTLPGLLAAVGTERIDRVVISHAHRGHAGGMGSVKSQVAPDRIHSAVPGVGKPCTAGQYWQSGGYQFRFLHPSAGLPYLNANSSCVLWISGPGGSILLPGGIDATVEQRLLLENPNLDVDVLVLSAGGHRRAGHADFLDQLDPALALASVARFDRFERPHPELLERLERADIDWLSTGNCGAIRVRLAPGRPAYVETLAGRSARFWRPHRSCP